MTFVAPVSNVSGFHKFTLLGPSDFKSSVLLYYAQATQAEDFACPDGAQCPGSGRIWPQPGYWSPDEFSTPVKCDNEAACPGFQLQVPNNRPIPP